MILGRNRVYGYTLILNYSYGAKLYVGLCEKKHFVLKFQRGDT